MDFYIKQKSLYFIIFFNVKKGYKGALCQECDLTGEIWGDNYGNTSEYTCNSCNEAL